VTGFDSRHAHAFYILVIVVIIPGHAGVIDLLHKNSAMTVWPSLRRWLQAPVRTVISSASNTTPNAKRNLRIMLSGILRPPMARRRHGFRDCRSVAREFSAGM
jgi:hypothetical protein